MIIMNSKSKTQLLKYVGLFCLCVMSVNVMAHHVLGRPAYSLNEDSNTPPSMEVETQIGQFFVTYMVFPAFPKAGERGRVNVYASRIENGQSFDGNMSFSVRNDVLFGNDEKEVLGTQIIDDGVYRQGFEFSKDGAYIITASFIADGEPYEIDFPLQVGESSGVAPVMLAIGVIIFILISVNVVQRRRIMREKIRSLRDEERNKNGAAA